MLRGVPTPPGARLHPVALIENEEAIQAFLMEVINAIARNTIDLRRADLILKALHIAVKNSRRVQFDYRASTMVDQIPDYPTQTSHGAASALARRSGPELSGRSELSPMEAVALETGAT